jgi:hypothetical protein
MWFFIAMLFILMAQFIWYMVVAMGWFTGKSPLPHLKWCGQGAFIVRHSYPKYLLYLCLTLR